RDRARDVPRLRVHRVDRLDGSAARHRAMLAAHHDRRKKSGEARAAATTFQWTAAHRRGRRPWLLAAARIHARAARRRPSFALPFAFLGLLRGRAAQTLALLDQLADLLATLVADLRVELGTAAGAHALSALLADLLVELVPALRFDGLSTLLADLLVEGASALLRDLHASFATRFGNRHPALLLVRHLLPPVV